MKVLFTIDSLAQGGTEQSLAELIGHFNTDVEVTVVYFYNAHTLRETYLKLRCKLIYMDISEKYGFYQAVLKLKKLVNSERPDLIVGSLYRSLMITRFVSWLTGIPMVSTFVNERYTKEQKERFKGIGVSKYYLTWLMDRLTSFIPRKIISNSYSIALSNAAALGISNSRIKVVYRGRDTGKMKAWTCPDNKHQFIWMAIGRLIPQKGYEHLLKAMTLLVRDFPQIHLHIIGEGSLRDEIQNQINQLELSRFVSLNGNIPDAWQQLYQANAFVLPSVSEGFSGALVEALITGIPLVASDIPMNLEAISPGRLSFIFPVGNHIALAGQMARVMTEYEEAKRIGKIARERAIDYYDIKKVSAEYEAALKQVVNGK